MESLYNLIIDIINSVSVYGIVLNGLLIIIESIIPPLPLGVFITVLFVNYGKLLGFFMAWCLTIIGCLISFYIFKKFFKNPTDKYLRKYKNIDKYITLVDNIKFSNLVLILSIPFTPAFLVNITAGISKVDITKFLPAILIGKIPLVLFWGYIGTSLLESLRNPTTIIIVILLVSFAYFFSKIVNRKLKID